jgi:HPt (histidine-containing phosphotransfer) domain-containing protein
VTTTAPYDLPAASVRLGLDPEQIRELLDLFVDEGRRHLRAIDQALPFADADEVQLAAHTIKGGAAMLGLDEIEACAREVECLAREQRLAEAPSAVRSLRAGLLSLAQHLALAPVAGG